MPRPFLVIVLLLTPATLDAGDKPAAKLRSPSGTLLQRGADKWLTPMLYDAVPAEAQLVALPGARAILEIKEGDVRLVLAGNLPALSPTPVLESVVKLQAPAAGHDLEFTLERGRVLIESHKDTGLVKIRARIQGKDLDFDLLNKNTVVALELFSRWPVGAPFFKKPEADHKPIGELIFLVVRGKAEVELNKQKQPLQGPAMYQFNTQRGVEGPLALKKAPDWVNPPLDQPESVKTLQAAVEKLRRGIADQGAMPALAKAQASKETSLTVVATYSGIAVDNLAAGITALKSDKSKDVRMAGVGALTHYIGRGSAEDIRLYETLVADKLKPGQASIIIELLHGMSEEARLRPETYSTLITYLENDQLAIRELAAMNLNNLVPQGKDIAFDAAAASAQRAQAQAAWRKLIPEGQVPKMAN
ncbi:MAG TPA: hypothetical protein VNX28_03400 [Gemmataceae bacterium]|nr:hypothetical protein [Gemmataceae bacterium]